ncbi:MAG: hypothetical protein ACKVH8_01965 [Pirellulales bacterium]|jgi:hypothetical protein
MSVRVPTYRLHKGSGQALVQINGRRIYLGVYDSPQSHEEYRRLIAEYLSHGEIQEHTSTTKSITVDELILAYYQFAQKYYVKNGRVTDEVAGIRAVLSRLCQMYGTSSACEFGPKAYKLVN